MSLSDDEVERYARHLILREIGGAGQARLSKARVLVVGAGGLGSPAILYLAAAGVGTIGVVDPDHVSLSNLQRQIAHCTQDVGRLKAESAVERAHAINPHVRLEAHPVRLGAENAECLIAAHDLVIDGSDSFGTRFLVNDTCYRVGRTLVSGAVGQFDGQVAVYKAHLRPEGQRIHPCYRCLVPEAPEGAETCTGAGVVGALTGIIGSMQALEAIKEILGIGESLAGRLMLYDGLGSLVRTVRLPPDPACAVCGAV
jgi:molybdopterin/thiamine biosynthesis adenylyltransferase